MKITLVRFCYLQNASIQDTYLKMVPKLGYECMKSCCNKVELSTANSLYCGHPWRCELVSLTARVSNSRNLFQSNTCIIVLRGLSCCPYYQGISEVSARWELTVVEINFSQTSVIYFCWGFRCCPYYRGVHYSEVPPRWKLTVHTKTNKL